MQKGVSTKIKEAGVVGAGGAGFPTHQKVASAAKTIVVNGAECEPLLRVDQQLMESKAGQIVEALLAVKETSGAQEIVIVLKAKYKGAVAALQEQIADEPIRLHLLGDFYPAGDEHVTVFEATGRLVPQGGIPLHVDSIVLNVETLLNISQALKGNPVTDTYLTVAGHVPQPVTFRLPVGTSIKQALALAGVMETKGMAVIDGGPMMGKIVEDLSQPITKTTKGLIVLPQNHPLIRKRTISMERVINQTRTACVQCRYCTDLCPRYLLGHNLEPHKIMRTIKHLNPAGQEDVVKMALTCSECGACEQYACIMNLSPRAVNALLKRQLTQQGVKPNTAPVNQKTNLMHKERKIPIKRLISRLGLANYDRSAPLDEKEYSVNRVEIMLKQHVGEPCLPIVHIGQMLEKGELIAEIPGGALGARVHSSISGVVTGVTDRIIVSAVEGSEQ